MKIDTVIDIAFCKKTSIHTRLARNLMMYKEIYNEETISDAMFVRLLRTPNYGGKTNRAFHKILSDLKGMDIPKENIYG
jgi:hypothetical protein